MSTIAIGICYEAMPYPVTSATHEELRYRCPHCATRMESLRAIDRGLDRAQHVFKCPRCSVIMTERARE